MFCISMLVSALVLYSTWVTDFECSHVTTTRKTDVVMRRSLKQFTKASGYGNSKHEYQLWEERKIIKLS